MLLPDGSTITVHRLLRAFGLDTEAFEPQTPVIGYGSNASPIQLTRKFVVEDFQGIAVIPTMKGTIKDYDVVFSPHFVSYGAMPPLPSFPCLRPMPRSGSTGSTTPNSCRNRHCPKCQGAAARDWLAEREADLLPVPYFHVVFTLPAAIADIAYQNKAVIGDPSAEWDVAGPDPNTMKGVGAVLTARDVAAERRGPAAHDGRHRLKLAEAHMARIGSAPGGPVATEDVGDLQPRAAHGRRAVCRGLGPSASGASGDRAG